MGIEYDRDKAYNEGIFNTAGQQNPQGNAAYLGNQSSLGMISGAGGQNAGGGGGLSGGQTGKLPNVKTKKGQQAPSSTNVDGGGSLLDAAKSSKSGVE